MRKVLLLFSALACGLISFAQVTSISVETFYVDNGSVTGYPAGYTTYRIFANCTSPTDVVASVIGDDSSPLALSVSGGVWNHPGGGVIGSALNAGLFGFIPALQYDSYVTIGRSSTADPGAAVYTVEDPGQVWTTPVFNTSPLGATTMNINSIVGGAWFAFPGDVNAFAGADLKILIAQITTNGPVCGSFNLQVFPTWDSPGDPSIIQTNLTFGTGANCGPPGCTDPDALNFDENAGFDNGLCLYPCALEISEITAIPPTCAGNNNGSIYFEGAGGQDFISYTFNGADGGLTPDLYSNLGNGTYTLMVSDTRFENELFNPGGVYGTCEATEQVVFNVQPLVFGTVTPNQVTCGGLQNGCISSTVTGGVGTLSYSVLTCTDTPVASGLTAPQYCGLGGGSYRFSVVDQNGCTAVSNCATVVSPAALNLILLSNSTTDCPDSEDGQQVVSWTGGTGDVDFSLENDGVYDIEGNLANVVLSGLGQGTYTLYAADANGCTDTVEFSITGPPAIIISGEVTQPSCFGAADGALVVTSSGGTFGTSVSSDGGVNFSFSIELINLEAGDITILAQDGLGCTTEQTFVIQDPAPLAANIQSNNISCFGEADGSATVVASGGTGSYTYSIDGGSGQASNTFIGLAEGSYDLTVQDANGCVITVTDGVNIIEPEVLEAQVSATNALCNSGSGTITVVADGGTPNYSYSIDGGAFGPSSSFQAVAGEYSIAVQDASGCFAAGNAIISEPEAIVITGLSADPIDETPGGSTAFTVTGGTGSYTFEWTNANGVVVSTSQNLSGLDQATQAGVYTLTVTDVNGCTSVQEILITGLDEMLAGGFSAALVPNPTMGMFQIRVMGLTGERLQYRVLDTQGRTVLFSDLGNAGGQRTESLDITTMASGVYYVQLTVGDDIHTMKLIKQD